MKDKITLGLWLLVPISAIPDISSFYFDQGRHPIPTQGQTYSDLSYKACARCHPDITQEWQQSRHAASWRSKVFQIEYQESPRQWCVNCHAPLQAQQTDAVLRDEGIGCAACHIRDGAFIAKTKSKDSPHQTIVDSQFGGPRYCSGCHQFNFPRFDQHGDLRGFKATPMQNTGAEFSTRAKTLGRPSACQDCHRSKHRHVFPGVHAPGFIARSIRVGLCEEKDERLRLWLKNVGGGHNLPTGGVNRSIKVQAWRSSAPEGLFERRLGRTFAAKGDQGLHLTSDTTLPSGETATWTIPRASLGGTPNDDINIRVNYSLLSERLAEHAQDPDLRDWEVIAKRLSDKDIHPCPDVRDAQSPL